MSDADGPRILRLRDPIAALGVALHFLGQREPFAGFGARILVTTVDGQIRRGHHLMASQGQRLVGFIGWVMLDEAAQD